jgi:hypothetical protein
VIDPDAFDFAWESNERHPIRSALLTAAICAALAAAVGYLSFY